jgi:hypothetical protein
MISILTLPKIMSAMLHPSARASRCSGSPRTLKRQPCWPSQQGGSIQGLTSGSSESYRLINSSISANTLVTAINHILRIDGPKIGRFPIEVIPNL